MAEEATHVKMTEDALEHYGEEWRDVVLVITHSANKYMPAEEFYAAGMPNGYHPGYDEGMRGMSLFDLKREDNNEDLPFSLYQYEVQWI